MFTTRENGEGDAGDAAPHSTLGAGASGAATTRRSASRVRSQSEHSLLAGHSTSHDIGLSSNGGGLLLDSEDERDADAANGATPSAPIGIGAAGGSGASMPIPFAASASLAPRRPRFNRREFFLQGNLSPTSSEDEEAAEQQQQHYSTSYAGPSNLAHYTFEMAPVTGYLEKQSVKSPDVWKRRWFVMQDSVLFYYRNESDAIDTKPTDRTCCGVIQLDSVDSVTTAKDYGDGAFQIRLSERKYILRAASKENMHDWLFNFQKSIANIISVLLRTKTDHRFTRGHHSVTRRQSLSRVSRSVSFDYPDNFEFGRMSADFPSHHFQSDLLDPNNSVFSDEFPSETTRTSPRRASSPLNFSQYGPRSPVSIFAFDPPFESISDEGLGMGENGPLIEGVDGEEDEDSEDVTKHNPLFEVASGFAELAPAFTAPVDESPVLQRTLSPPVTAGKYVPRFMRDRQNAVPAPPPIEIASPPRQSPPPPSSSLSWLLRTSRDCYAVCTGESETVVFDDNVSFTGGGENHGVTSLKGVRKSLEDVCCCVPDLNLHLPTEEYAKHSLYALFDGHCGIRAAKYLDEKLLTYLCEHESFTTNARQAFIDAFKRIDDEFLARATAELVSDGSTAAVVLIRGNKLLTANIGDSRAVVSINGVALDVIEEQTPGRPDERQRIEKLGGWVKEERELQMSKLHSMDLSDPWIKQKAERVVRWVNVYRVNGELAVSRAIGDMEYKGKALTDYEFWAFPEGHDRKFLGDLVICDPEFKEIEITPEVKFIILACDGLWDTITSQEAVNHVKEKISEGYSTSQISHSLADLAIRSGSSDNVSVIVVILHQ